MVWVVNRFRLKAPPGISSSCISPLTSSAQRSRASWASQPQKSATLSPQPGGKPRKNMWWHWRGKKRKNHIFPLVSGFCTEKAPSCSYHETYVKSCDNQKAILISCTEKLLIFGAQNPPTLKNECDLALQPESDKLLSGR